MSDGLMWNHRESRARSSRRLAHGSRQTGAAVEARVRTYDFRRAMRFSKDQIRIITRIHEYFARLWATHLSAELRTNVQLNVESVEEVRYDEFIGSIPPLTVVQVLQFYPLDGKILVEINLQLAFAVVDRLIGGPGFGPYRDRELTSIEQTLLERVLTMMADDIGSAWRSATVDVQPRRGAFEHNPQFLQLVMPNETVLVVTLSARISRVTGLINICIPHVTLEPLLPGLTHHRLTGGGAVKSDGEASERLASHMNDIPVDVTVELGEAYLSFAELLDLQVGDVIPLNHSIHQPVVVRVDGVPTFTASVGTARRHYAVKILDEWNGGTGRRGQL